MIVLYSTECPKCNILKQKLETKKITYETNNNKDEMIKRGFSTVPMLEVNGRIMNFGEAVKWVNNGGE